MIAALRALQAAIRGSLLVPCTAMAEAPQWLYEVAGMDSGSVRLYLGRQRVGYGARFTRSKGRAGYFFGRAAAISWEAGKTVSVVFFDDDDKEVSRLKVKAWD